MRIQENLQDLVLQSSQGRERFHTRWVAGSQRSLLWRSAALCVTVAVCWQNFSSEISVRK